MVTIKAERFIDRLKNDISASATVFLVALPLCLGISFASNAPPISGMLSGIIGGVVVGLLSGSHTSVSGPAAGLAAIIAAQITVLGSFETFLTSVVIAGVIQILMGLMKTGFIAKFFPSSVIKGVLSTIGLILILKQLPHLVGFDMDYEGDMAFFQADQENTFSEILKMFSYIHPGATLVGFLSAILLIGWERIDFLKRSRFPASLVVVCASGLLNHFLLVLQPSWFITADHRVNLPSVNNFFEVTKVLAHPKLSALFDGGVIMAAITLALVASLETLLNLEAADKLDKRQRKSPPNQELIAQGIGNLILGLLGGLPVTSVVVRSSVNVHSNASSKNSTILHGIFLAFAVVAMPKIISGIPLASLAAILIITGFKLINPKVLSDMWGQGLDQFFSFATTIIAIIFSDLLIGVAVGVTVNVFLVLKNNFKNPMRIIIERHLGDEVIRIALANQVSFLNRASLATAFESIPNGGHVAIDASDSDYIDGDVLQMIRDFAHDSALKRDIVVSLLGFKRNSGINNSINFAEHATTEIQKNIAPHQVLEMIKAGNQRVIMGQRLKRDLYRQITATSSGQFPLAVFLSCIDSRVPTELIFDLGIGDAFSIRMAGHVISDRVLGSLEFACAIAGAKLIVVMGHTKCGAISATIDSMYSGISVEKATGCKHLNAIVNDVQKIIEKISSDSIFDKSAFYSSEFENQVVIENVLESIRGIREKSPVIAELINSNRVGIAGCVYNVSSGRVDFLSPAQHDLPSIDINTYPLQREKTPASVL